MLYYNYKTQRKRKGKPREIGERKATGLRSRLNISSNFSLKGQSERQVSRAAEAVTEKGSMKGYGFFIEDKLKTLRNSLRSLYVNRINGQSIIEYTLIFIAFMLAVIWVFGAQGQRVRGMFEDARDTAVERIER